MMVLCHTVKAKGLSFGEGKASFHFWNANPEQLQQANEELDAQIAVLEQEAKTL